MTDEAEDRDTNHHDGSSDDDGTGGLPDPVLVALAALDPGLADAPPARGSARHHSILEHAMTITSTTTTTVPDHERPAGMDPTRAIRSPRRRLALLAAAAALLAVIVGAVVVLEPWRQATPASARQVLRSAATATGDVASLRAAGTYDLGTGVVIKMTSEIDGADYSSTFRSTGLPDADPGGDSTTRIGDTRWETDGGRTTKRTVPPEEGNAPFPESSEAVVKAALVGSKVTDLGIEDVRSQEVTHYRIQLTPASTEALAKLTPSQLARFELEYPQDVASLDVWVADDLIRRISVRSDSEGVGTSTIEFYDFGSDITIRPPS